jgi:hypothetical protein
LEAPWIDQWRRRLEEVRLRGLECFVAAGLGLGGPVLAQAEERARLLTECAPYRETGHRMLMETLERRGNVAEALRAYERLRVLLRHELGIARGRAAQSGGAHSRTCAPSSCNRTASPTSGSTSPRPPYVDNSTRTTRPHFRRPWPRPAILRHDPGLAARPLVRYTLKVEGNG